MVKCARANFSNWNKSGRASGTPILSILRYSSRGGGNLPPLSLRRVKPTSQTIRNIAKVVRAESCHSKFDQNNIMILKEKWEANANLMFIPKGANVLMFWCFWCFDWGFSRQDLVQKFGELKNPYFEPNCLHSFLFRICDFGFWLCTGFMSEFLNFIEIYWFWAYKFQNEKIIYYEKSVSSSKAK